MDIVTANQFTYGTSGFGRISVFRNNSSGTGNISFLSPVEISINPAGDGSGAMMPSQVIATDINGDGKPDLVVSCTDAIAGGLNNVLSVFQNNASSGSITTSSFGAMVSFPVASVTTGGAFSVGLAASDIDGDGKLDIVMGEYGDGNITLFRNTSGGTINSSSFVVKATYATGGASSTPIGVTIGDMDGDTKPDILVANRVSNSISIFRNYPVPVSDTISGHTHLCAPDVDSFKNTVAGGTWSVTNTANYRCSYRICISSGCGH
jgi:hypothetical protein